MIGLALVGMVSVLAESIKASVDRAFDRGFGAEFALQGTGISGFSPEAAAAAARVPGVRSVTPVQQGMIEVADTRLPLLVADPAALVTPIKLSVVGGSQRLGVDELLVARDVAEAWRWQVGSIVPGEYPDGARASFRIAGIFADNQLIADRPYVMAPASYQPHVPSRMIHTAYVDAPDGAAVRSGLEAALADYPNVSVQDRQQAKAQARGAVDQLLGLVIGLLVLSIVIAALGIVNTLALSVLERTREIGLLRAVGMSRRQLRRMVRWEAVVIALFGAALGLSAGLGFGWALQRALAEEGVAVLSVPTWQLAGYAVAAAVIGVVAAIWPARRAAWMEVLRAITTE